MSLALFCEQGHSSSAVSLSLTEYKTEDTTSGDLSPLEPETSEEKLFRRVKETKGWNLSTNRYKSKRSGSEGSSKRSHHIRASESVNIPFQAAYIDSPHLSSLFELKSRDNNSLLSSFESLDNAASEIPKMTPISHTIISSSTAVRATFIMEKSHRKPVIIKKEDSHRDEPIKQLNAGKDARRLSLATPPHGAVSHAEYGFGIEQQSQHHFYHQINNNALRNHNEVPLIIEKPISGAAFKSEVATDSLCIGIYQNDTQVCEYCKNQHDTPEGYLNVKVGDLIAARYLVQRVLGQGTFGTVIGCRDVVDPFAQPVAIKIIRNIPKYRRAARTEIQVLQALHSHKSNPLCYEKQRIHPSEYCIRMEFWFEYCHHICMVFPWFKTDVYRHLATNQFTGFTLKDIQCIGYQLLAAVTYIHKLRLIHTDIKPENLLLKDDKSVPCEGKRRLTNNQILLIDFGSTIHEDQYHGPIVSTRHYRAPEIILGLGWSFPCDIWSVGCVLFELFNGTQLFSTHDNLVHLAMMEVILGPFPKWMIKQYEAILQSEMLANGETKSLESESLFDRAGKVAFPTKDVPAISIRSVESVSKFVPIFSTKFMCSPMGSLFDLIKKCLVIDPNERITAHEARNHPFFSSDL